MADHNDSADWSEANLESLLSSDLSRLILSDSTHEGLIIKEHPSSDLGNDNPRIPTGFQLGASHITASSDNVSNGPSKKWSPPGPPDIDGILKMSGSPSVDLIMPKSPSGYDFQLNQVITHVQAKVSIIGNDVAMEELAPSGGGISTSAFFGTQWDISVISQAGHQIWGANIDNPTFINHSDRNKDGSLQHRATLFSVYGTKFGLKDAFTERLSPIDSDCCGGLKVYCSHSQSQRLTLPLSSGSILVTVLIPSSNSLLRSSARFDMDSLDFSNLSPSSVVKLRCIEKGSQNSPLSTTLYFSPLNLDESRGDSVESFSLIGIYADVASPLTPENRNIQSSTYLLSSPTGGSLSPYISQHSNGALASSPNGTIPHNDSNGAYVSDNTLDSLQPFYRNQDIILDNPRSHLSLSHMETHHHSHYHSPTWEPESRNVSIPYADSYSNSAVDPPQASSRVSSSSVVEISEPSLFIAPPFSHDGSSYGMISLDSPAPGSGYSRSSSQDSASSLLIHENNNGSYGSGYYDSKNVNTSAHSVDRTILSHTGTALDDQSNTVSHPSPSPAPSSSTSAILRSISSLPASVAESARSQAGSRFLQTQLRARNPEVNTYILEKVIDQIPALADDLFGNYFLQTLFRVSPPHQREIILKALSPRLREIAMDSLGTYTVQSIVDLIENDPPAVTELEIFRNALVGDGNADESILQIMLVPHATHVLQRYLKRFPVEHCDFIYSSVSKYCDKLAVNANGIGVLLLSLEYAPQTLQKRLISYLMKNSVRLAVHRMGNYAISYLLGKRIRHRCIGDFDGLAEMLINGEPYDTESDSMKSFQFSPKELNVEQSTPSPSCEETITLSTASFSDDSNNNSPIAVTNVFASMTVDELRPMWVCAALCRTLRSHIVQLALGKYSSNVTEKCIVWGATERPFIYKEIFGHSPFSNLLLNEFSNYVVQTALTTIHPLEAPAAIIHVQRNLGVFSGPNVPSSVASKWSSLCAKLLAACNISTEEIQRLTERSIVEATLGHLPAVNINDNTPIPLQYLNRNDGALVLDVKMVPMTPEQLDLIEFSCVDGMTASSGNGNNPSNDIGVGCNHGPQNNYGRSSTSSRTASQNNHSASNGRGEGKHESRDERPRLHRGNSSNSSMNSRGSRFSGSRSGSISSKGSAGQRSSSRESHSSRHSKGSHLSGSNNGISSTFLGSLGNNHSNGSISASQRFLDDTYHNVSHMDRFGSRSSSPSNVLSVDLSHNFDQQSHYYSSNQLSTNNGVLLESDRAPSRESMRSYNSNNGSGHGNGSNNNNNGREKKNDKRGKKDSQNSASFHGDTPTALNQGGILEQINGTHAHMQGMQVHLRHAVSHQSPVHNQFHAPILVPHNTSVHNQIHSGMQMHPHGAHIMQHHMSGAYSPSISNHIDSRGQIVHPASTGGMNGSNGGNSPNQLYSSSSAYPQLPSSYPPQHSSFGSYTTSESMYYGGSNRNFHVAPIDYGHIQHNNEYDYDPSFARRITPHHSNQVHQGPDGVNMNVNLNRLNVNGTLNRSPFADYSGNSNFYNNLPQPNGVYSQNHAEQLPAANAITHHGNNNSNNNNNSKGSINNNLHPPQHFYGSLNPSTMLGPVSNSPRNHNVSAKQKSPPPQMNGLSNQNRNNSGGNEASISIHPSHVYDVLHSRGTPRHPGIPHNTVESMNGNNNSNGVLVAPTRGNEGTIHESTMNSAFGEGYSW